jgi:hypothetical protein
LQAGRCRFETGPSTPKPRGHMDLPRNTETITISVPSWLIAAIDEYCTRNNFSRSRLIARAVRKHLLQEIDTPDLWKQLYEKRFSEY